MKRFLSVIIAAALLIFGFNAFADGGSAEERPYYIDVVLHYGIMDMENSTDFLENETVQRADAVRFILKLLNEAEASSDYLPFNDVSPYDSYYGAISAAYNKGLISGNGNGKFYPERDIKVSEAATILLRAMGYSVMVGNGSLNTYESLASSKGFLKGVSSDNGYITRDGFAKLIYNSFSIGIVEQTSFGADNEYTVSADKTSLSFRGLKRAEGVVSANDISAVYYSDFPAKTGGIRINNLEYTISDNSFGELLGYYCEYYYFDENHSDEPTIDYIFPKNNDISKYQFEKGKYSRTDGGLLYTDDNGSSKTIKIPASAVIILNGSAVPYDLSYIIDGGTGSFSLIKHPGSSAADAVIINSYKNDIVAGIDKQNGYIYLQNSVINGKNYIELPIEDENGRIKVLRNGQLCEYTDSLIGDVISFAADTTGLAVTIYLSDKTVQGKLISESIGEDNITIGDTEYKKTADYPEGSGSLQLGTDVTAFLNFEGMIYDMSYTSSKRYAYVIKAGLSNEYEKCGVVKLFTAAGSAQTLKLAEKVQINGGEETENGSEYFKHETVIERLTEAKKQLICYELNSADEIKNIIFAKQPQDEYEDRNEFVLSHTKTTAQTYSGQTLDGIICRNSIVFSIPDEDEPAEEECSASKGNLTRSRNYTETVKFYDIGFDGSAGAVLLLSKASSRFTNNPTSVCVVKKIVDSIDRSGFPCKKLYYYSGSGESSVNIASDVNILLRDGCPSLKAEELSPGDVICFDTNSDGELSLLLTIYDCSENTEDGIRVAMGDGILNNRELAVIKGILRYKDSEKLVVQFNYNGHTAFEQMSYSGEGNVIVVSKEKNSVRTESLDRLKATNFAAGIQGDNIVIAGNRNNLTEVIIYE